MQPLQYLLAVLTMFFHQGATTHGEPSIPPPLQAVLTANNELFSALANYDVYTDSNRSVVDILQLFPGLSRFTALAFSTVPLLDFIDSFPEESHPALEAIRDITGKINSSLQESTYLEKDSLFSEAWQEYTKKCGDDDTNVRKAWVFLQNFLENGSKAKTMKEKSRLAGEFIAFYAQTDTENSVERLHRYITATKPGTLSYKICRNNVYMLGLYSSYLSTLMVVGLQMKVYYHTMMATGGVTKAQEAMTQLSDVYLAMQNTQLECLDDLPTRVDWEVTLSLIGILSKINYSRSFFEVINEKGNPIVTSLSDPKTASGFEEQLNTKFSLFTWTVVSIIWRKEDELRDGFDMVFGLPWTPVRLYLKYAPRDLSFAKQSCTEELCPSQSGRCRKVKALGGDICQCAKMFYGSKCGRSVQDDINQSLLGQGKTPIIVPKLTTSRAPKT